MVMEGIGWLLVEGWEGGGEEIDVEETGDDS